MIDFFSRLDKYMDYKGLNDNQITIKAGISNGLIGKARKRGSLSQENISKILYAFPELDANWLFLGKGNMLKQPEKSEHEGNKLLLQRIEELAIENNALRKEVEQLKNRAVETSDAPTHLSIAQEVITTLPKQNK